MKKFFTVITVLFLTVVFTLYTDICANILRESFIHTFTKIIPVIFPFLILSKLILKSGIMSCFGFFTKGLSKILGLSQTGTEAFVTANLCGFPIGASVCSELYCEKRIDKDEAYLITAFSNNVSTGFCVGYCGFTLFGSKKVGLVIYVVQFVSAFILCAVFGALKKQNRSSGISKADTSFPIIETVSGAAIDSVKITAVICCSSLLCYFIGFVAEKSGTSPSVICLLKGITEISNGTNEAVNLQTPLSLIFATFFIGFSGLSVLFQSQIFLRKTDLLFSRICIYKMLQGLLSSFLIYLLYNFLNLGI